MKREHVGILVGVLLMIVLLSTVGLILSKTPWRDDGDYGDGGEYEIEPQFINLTLRDIFYTDRTMTRSFDETLSTQWLVCRVDMINEGRMNYNTSSVPVILLTDERTHYVEADPVFFKDVFPVNNSIPPGGTTGGWLHYRIGMEEVPIELYMFDEWGVGFNGTVNIELETIGYRYWKTPLTMSIDHCGRDPYGAPHPGIFFMNITVENRGANASMFEDWHLRLNVTGGNVRDVMFSEKKNWTWIFPGEIKRYKLYFDIRRDHPEKPEVLVDVLNWIFVVVDEGLYSHLV